MSWLELNVSFCQKLRIDLTSSEKLHQHMLEVQNRTQRMREYSEDEDPNIADDVDNC